MKASTPALIVYIISGLLFLISVFVDNEYLALISKPIIIPSVFFYYWQERHGKINLLSAVVLFFLFISGILNLFDGENIFFYVIICNLLAYCILLSFVLKSLFELKFHIPDKINLSYIVLMFLFFSSLLYISLFLMLDLKFELYFVIIVYGISSVSLGSLSTILYTQQHSQANFVLMMTSFTFIMSDLFYVLYYYYFDFTLFRAISILSYIVSFYVLVNYFLLREQNVSKTNELN
ncbi:hypothetical protein [Flavobacterium sp.]|uniref:hypothetical protein n=1 Tax=Flavobacterium sp. TaxID=239 RepID=UPI00261ABD66|nr:hypothetical protein [Flavobacterium sp.]